MRAVIAMLIAIAIAGCGRCYEAQQRFGVCASSCVEDTKPELQMQCLAACHDAFSSVAGGCEVRP